jgi:alpha-beta hydrolase superfamily lysophospholipase
MTVFSEYTLTSCDDRGTQLHCVKWAPSSGEPAAILQINHGMQEHIERYSEFAEFLTEKGFAVFGHDHIGHGDSVSSEDERGILHTSTPSQTLVDDMFTQYRHIRSLYPDTPYFILGHSMGSYLLRMFLSSKSSSLSGLNGAIIIGTGTESDITILAGNALCRLIGLFKGRDYRSSFIKKHLYGRNYRKFDLTGNDPENSWLSKNVDNVKAFMDPSNKKDFFGFSVNAYLILLESIWFDNRMSNLRRMDPDIPVLFASGSQDPVGAMGKGVKKACEKFKKAGVKDLTLKLYEDDRHEILNETDRYTVYNDIYEWMMKRIK